VEFSFPDEESISQTEVTHQTLQHTIKDTVSYNYGDLGLAKIALSLQVKHINMRSRIAIIRVAREYIDIILTSVVLITSYQGRRIKLRVLHCSGTIKKIELKAKALLINWINRILKDPSLSLQVRAEFLDQSNKDMKELEKLE